MNLTEQQILNLWLLLGHAEGELAGGRETFILFLKKIHDQFEGYLNLAAISTGSDNYDSEIKAYCYLAGALGLHKNNLIFNQNLFHQLAEEVQEATSMMSLIELHGQNSNRSVIEKLLNGTFTAYEWLSDLDLRRLLEITDTKDRIKLTRFNSDDIGITLHFAREAGLKEIGLIVNKGASGLNEGVHWFAITVAIENDNSISYIVEDSLSLSDQEREAVRNIMTAAINYKVTSYEGGVKKQYHAFPDAVIKPAIFKPTKNQRDAFSCGYRAPHALMQNKELCGNNQNALRYAKTPLKTRQLVKCFCELQLSNIPDNLPITEKNMGEKAIGLIQSETPTDNNAPISKKVTEKLNSFDPAFGAVVFPGIVEKGEHLSAHDYYCYLIELRDKLIEKKSKLAKLEILPCDDEALEGLSKFCSDYSDLRFRELTLHCNATSSAERSNDEFKFKMQSLLMVLAHQPLAKLTLVDKHNSLQKEDWEELCEFMINRKIAVSVILPEPHSRSKLQQKLDMFISENQRELSNEQAKQSINRLKNAVATKKRELNREKRTRGKEMVAAVNFEMSREKQQQQEIKVQSKPNILAQVERDNEPTRKYDIMSYDEFEKAVKTQQLGVPSDSYHYSYDLLQSRFRKWFGQVAVNKQVVPHPTISGGTQKACGKLFEFTMQFDQGVDFNNLPVGFILINDPKELGKKILDYNDTHAEEQTQNKFSVECHPQLPLRPIPYSVYDACKPFLAPDIQKYLKRLEQVEDGVEYDRDIMLKMRSYASTLALLPQDSQDHIWNLCDDGRELNIDRLSYYLENLSIIAFQKVDITGSSMSPKDAPVDMRLKEIARQYPLESTIPGKLLLELIKDNQLLLNRVNLMIKMYRLTLKNINAMFQVYAHHGEEGLMQLTLQWEQAKPDRLDDLMFTFYNNMTSFEPLLNPVYRHSAKTIDTFDDIKYSWWKVLTEKHCDQHSLDDLPSCLAAFQEFLAQIDSMNLKLEPISNEIPNLNFKNASNLKTSLSFILTILEKTQVADRPGVWKTITHSALQSDSDILAISTPGCGFVVPEMLCTPSHFHVTTSDECTRGYRNRLWKLDNDDWHHVALKEAYYNEKSIALLKEWKIVKAAYNDTSPGDLKFLKFVFYRNLAFRSNRLSVSFYREALEKLEKKVLGIANNEQRGIIFSRLSAFLLSATSYTTRTAYPQTEKQMLSQWDTVIEHLVNPSVPDFTNKKVVQLSLGLTREGIVQEARDKITASLFKFKSMPALAEMATLLNDVKRKIGEMTIINHKKIVKELDEKLVRIEKILNVFGGDALSQGRQFYPEGSNDLNTYLDLCWQIYKLDEKRHKKLKSPGDNKAFISASKHGRLLMSLLSTFNINTLDQLKTCYKTLFAMTYHEGHHNKYFENLLTDLLKSLQGITQNSVTGKLLTPSDFIDLITLATTALTKNIHLLDIYAKDHSATESIDSYNKLRWNMIGQVLIKQLGKSIQVEHVENVLTYSSKRDSLNITIKKIFNDLKPANLLGNIERFAGRYTSEIESDQTILDNLNKILSALDEDHRLRFIKILLRDQIWHAASFDEISKLIKLISQAPPHHTADFFYICDQSVASQSENLIKAAKIYIDTIVPSLPSLPGLKRFDTLPLAANILLRESKDTIGLSPNVNTPAIDFWNKVMALLAEPEGIKLGDIEELWGNAPNKDKCQAFTDVFNEVKKLHNPQESSFEFGKALNSMVSYVTGFIFSTPTPTHQSKEISKSLIELALSEIAENKEREYEYKAVFFQFIQRISNINERYPLIKHELITFINSSITDPLAEGQSLMAAVWKKLDAIETLCREIKDEKVIRSLLFWYSGGADSIGRPDNLQFLVTMLKNTEAKNASLRVIAKLLDNNHKINDKLINRLYTSLLKGDGDTNEDTIINDKAIANEEAITKVNDFYKNAPYPTLLTTISWLECSNEDQLAKDQRIYNITPCPRDARNGFNYEEAVKQSALCVGLHFSPNELRNIDLYYKHYKDVKTDELLKIYHVYKTMHKTKLKGELGQLAVITAELLYRAKAIPGEEEIETKNESFEINTTQYLAVLALLKGQHITAGIGTSEGKSRIMMIVNACAYALGKTPDFITSDLVLGKRDFLAAQSLFNLIGAESTLIYADSPFTSYKLGGINYSDSSNISLFRNRAYSVGMRRLVIETDTRKRACMLDEADKPYYDMSDTKFNYSSDTNEALEGMEWVYPLLIKLLKDPSDEVQKAYYEDIDGCTDMFLKFASANGCTEEQLTRLENMRTQLDTWQTSAAIALKLQYKIHFNIKGDTLINTSKGPVMACDIRLIVHKRDVEGAKFSSGVHQCLIAHLNMLKDKPDDSDLSREIAKYQNDFYMEPEKSIVYSSTSQDLLDEYRDGTIIAVTATPGVDIELEEARRDVAYNDESGSQVDMQFVSIPRHKGLKRVDKPVLLTNNEKEHHQAIIAAIEKAMLDAQPVLLICENDTDSEALLNVLKKTAFKTNRKPILQRIHSGSPEEEDQMIQKSGEPFMVTISTSMIGRGTDIDVKFDSDFDEGSDLEKGWQGVDLERGLKGICTYLPTSRELIQIFGRSGRKGQDGDAQLILNKENLPPAFQMDDDDDESKIIKLQAWMDRKNQCKRLVLKANSQFIRKLYEKYLATVPTIQAPFILFETQANQAWGLVMAHIRDEINKDYPDVDVIQKHLDDYQESVEVYWLELCGNTASANQEHKLPTEIPRLSLDENSKHLLQHFDLADALAPAQLKKILALLDDAEGVYQALCLLSKYINHSETAKAALIKRVEEETTYLPNKEKYDFILSYCRNDDNDVLQRVINTYVNQREKNSKHAEILVRLIKQFIETIEWAGWRNKSYETPKHKLKLPDKIHEIYYLINVELAKKPAPDYLALITNISQRCAGFNKPASTVGTRQHLSNSDQFYLAMKQMHDKLNPAQQNVNHH